MKNLLDRHLKKPGARRPVSGAPGLKTTLSTRKVLSLRGQSILPNLDKMWNGYSAACLATLAFSSTENFSYVPCIAVPLCILVFTTAFCH